MAEKRFNIGLVLSNITDVYSNCVARGAMKEAKKQNVDLIIFPGKYVGLEYRYLQIDARYEYQYNVLFDHAAAAGLDHLIVAIGTIAYAYDTSKKLEFMKKFNGNRVMLLSGNLEGYDFLIYDNATGIKEAIKALKEQGKKHIGMMVGQLNNTECSERYMAYRQGMEENGLEFKDSYIITSDISERAVNIIRHNVECSPLAQPTTCEPPATAAHSLPTNNSTSPAINIVPQLRDFFTYTAKEIADANPEGSAPVIVLNPPYGKRLDFDAPALYTRIGKKLAELARELEPFGKKLTVAILAPNDDPRPGSKFTCTANLLRECPALDPTNNPSARRIATSHGGLGLGAFIAQI